MANPRELDKRRKSIRNIRKITRTMELIATARYRRAMDRASAATAYTNQMSKLVRDLVRAGVEVEHPLLASRSETKNAVLLLLSANRGLCGGFNGNLVRAAVQHWKELQSQADSLRLEVSGKRGINGCKHRGLTPERTYTQFEDRPEYAEIEEIANRYLDQYATGEIDRLDVVYTKFVSVSRQVVTTETLLPLGSIAAEDAAAEDPTTSTEYEFLPSPESILEEVVPASFKVKLFKCFLDGAVSEQIARMVAMKAATENADDLIRRLSRQYNRARQGRITNELMDLIGGVEAIS